MVNLVIEKFTTDDIVQATQLAVEAWSDAIGHWGEELTYVVCEYSVRAELLNSSFALKVTDGTKMRGYLFAATATDKNDADEWIKAQRSRFSRIEDFEILDMVVSSTRNNEKMVVRNMKENDAMLTFFLSTQKGCGKMLLTAMNDLLKSCGYKNMLLWTDITCNHGYYPHNGFELVEEKSFDKYDFDEPFVVYIYKKGIK